MGRITRPTKIAQAWENVWDACKGVGYTIVSPIEGTQRGHRGYNSPLDYGSINGNEGGRYGNTPGGYAGAFLNATVGTVGAVGPWVIFRTARFLAGESQPGYSTLNEIVYPGTGEMGFRRAIPPVRGYRW